MAMQRTKKRQKSATTFLLNSIEITTHLQCSVSAHDATLPKMDLELCL